MHLISKIQPILIILLVCSVPLGNVMAAAVLLSDDFEQSSLGNSPAWAKCSGNCLEATAEKSRNGSRSLKTYLHKFNSQRSYRTEIVSKSLKNAQFKDDYWYGFSTYVPSNHIADHKKNVDLLFQWHAVGVGSKVSRGSSVLAVMIEGNNWLVKSSWNTTWKGDKNSPGKGAASWLLGPVAKGKWTDWVVHAKWSASNDGVLEVWKNGKRVVTRNGPNAYNDPKGPYLKFGLYKPRWRQSNDKLSNPRITSRTYYHDSIKVVRGADATFADVDPAKSRSSSSNGLAPPSNLKIK